MKASSEGRLRERKHGLLWFVSGKRFDGSDDGWNITDPESEALAAACRRLRPVGPSDNGGEWPNRTPEEKQRDSDLYTVLRCVSDYQYLTTYALGVEHVIRKLRVIWRALREAALAATAEEKGEKS